MPTDSVAPTTQQVAKPSGSPLYQVLTALVAVKACCHGGAFNGLAQCESLLLRRKTATPVRLKGKLAKVWCGT